MRRALFIAYASVIAVLCGAILYSGPVTQMYFGHDFFSLTEGAWKIVNGHVPYLDFETLIGPLTYLILAAGMTLTGPDANAFPVANVLGLVLVSLLAWHVFSRRLGPAICLTASLYLAVVWAAPFPLHFDYVDTSYAMNYNRQSYVILSLLLTVLVVDLKRDYFLIGVLLGLLLFFKIPYFVAGMFLFAAYFAASLPTGKSLLCIGAGFLAVLLPMTVYLRGMGLVDMLEDFHLATKTHDPETVATGLNLLKLELPVPLILLIFALFFLVDLSRRWPCPGLAPSSFLPIPARLWLEGAIVVAVAIVAEMGSSPLGWIFDIPLLGVYSLILFDRLLGLARRELKLPEKVCCLLCAGCCLGLFVPLFTRPVLGYYETVEDKAYPKDYRWQTRIAAGGMRDIQIYGLTGKYPPGFTYADKINDGLALIRRHPELPALPIASLDFTDGFSFPLQRPSPPHMPLGLQYGYNVSEKIQPDGARILDGCGALMVPKYPEFDARTVPLLLDKYRGYLAENFVRVDESPLWILYRRK